jgi:hypothetical protein
MVFLVERRIRVDCESLLLVCPGREEEGGGGGVTVGEEGGREGGDGKSNMPL